jgi:histidyl-tRNA synthetase
VLRAIDKLDKFGIEGVALLLGEGRKDESGDFTKGAGLDATNADPRSAYVSTGKIDGNEGTKNWAKLAINEALVLQRRLLTESRSRSTPPSSAASNITPARSTRRTAVRRHQREGRDVQFGSVGGGGRYDGLVKRFTGRDVPATGFPSASRG